MVFNEKYTKILELATEQDEELKAVLNQMIKQLTEDEKACLGLGKAFTTTHLIEGEGEPFLRGAEFGNYKRQYGYYKSAAELIFLDEIRVKSEDYFTKLEKQGRDKIYRTKTVKNSPISEIPLTKKEVSLNLTNFTKEWIDNLETFDSIDAYNKKCNSNEGVEATDILRLNVTTHNEQGKVTSSKTYSINVVKISNDYYLEHQRTVDNNNTKNKPEHDKKQAKMISITKDELYAIVDLDRKIQNNI